MRSGLLGLSLLMMMGAWSSVEAQTERTLLDGVYTDEQALRGEDIFYTVCTGCHETWEFTDAAFHQAWVDEPVYFIAKDIKELMPDDNPGILSQKEVVDVLSYMLQMNGYPTGDAELPEEEDALRTIIWKIPPNGGR